ncbi:hypothetical protein Tco_1358805 [Tanacetum coccineum]
MSSSTEYVEYLSIPVWLQQHDQTCKTMPETRAIYVCTVSLLLMTADSKSLLRNCNFTVITVAEPWYSVLSASHASFAEFAATILENIVSSTAFGPGVDRLNELKDEMLVNNIMSRLDCPTKELIRTTATISKRWKNLWTQLPHLIFSYEDDITDFGSDVFHRFMFIWIPKLM